MYCSPMFDEAGNRLPSPAETQAYNDGAARGILLGCVWGAAIWVVTIVAVFIVWTRGL